MRKFTVLVAIVNIPIFLIFIIAIFFVWSTTYEDFISKLLYLIHQPEKTHKLHNLFNPDRFFVLRCLTIACLIVHLLLVVFIFRKRSQIIAFCKEKLAELKELSFTFFQPLLQLTASQKILLLIFTAIWMASRIYFIVQLPFHIDERFTYLYFIKPGWLVSVAYYQPNNHILYTLLCNVTHLLLQNPVWVMKIPAFLIGTIFPYIFFLTIRQFFDFKIAFPAMAFACFNTQIYYYSLQGRGYILLVLCVITAAGSLIQLIQKENFWLYFLFTISCLSGFYAIPIFLYPFAGMVVYGGIMLWRKSGLTLIRFGVVVGTILLLSFLLYLPALLFSGWDAITGNNWVKSQPFISYLQLFPESIEAIAQVVWFDLPFSIWLTILYLAFSVWYCFNAAITNNVKLWLALSMVMWLVLLPVLLFQRPLIHQRVFVYLWVFQGITLGIFLSFFIHQRVMLLFTLLFVGHTFYQMYQIAHPEKTNFYTSADNVAQLLFSQNADNLYFNSYDYSLCTRFLYETSERRVRISVREEQKEQFNYLVLEKSSPQTNTSHFSLIFEDEMVKVFKRQLANKPQ
jgi:hypothetical protein